MNHEWPLLGRAEELRIVVDATQRYSVRSRGIVISGPAGVGKTRIAREAAAGSGPPGARRCWILGTASARGVPLGAFADIAGDLGPDPLRRIREVIDGLTGGANPDHVVIGVDDAHLLDDLSAFTVHQLVTRRLATVILTIRSGEPVPDAITAIWKDQYLERLELQPLSAEEIAALVEHVLDGPVHSLCAHRLWQYTQGNVLHLRHLIDSEVDAGRITRHSGVWMWDGQPRLSPTLAQVLETRIGQVPLPVRDVLDALAVTEPLDIDILTELTDTEAIAEAESLGLVRIDAPAVRLAHPMLGEVRRTDSPRMRRLHGRIATELARRPSTDPRDAVRRVMLVLESDLPPDPALLNAATSAAIQLTDMRLAESLAERAVAAGGGLEAKIAHAMALIWQERGPQAEAVLAELADETDGPLRVQIALLRALNFAVIIGQLSCAEAELDLQVIPGDPTVDATAMALRATIEVNRGHAGTAVELARSVMKDPAADAIARMLSIWVLVSGLGELGRISEVHTIADVGYALADTAAEVSHLRLPLTFLHAYMCRLAGALAQADTLITRIRRDTIDVPIEGSWQVSESWHAFVAGLSAVNRGALGDAQRLCRESLADFVTPDSVSTRRSFTRLWLATVAGMSGRAADARREFEGTPWWSADPDACARDPERTIAQAWMYASEDAVPQAISMLHEAAAQTRSRPGWEVLFLQVATQFGDGTTAARLVELADVVEGPRAAAAAVHAAALSTDDGDGLLEAAHLYEAFGDRIAAADAAAQAARAYLDAGRRGAAQTASATAERLATACGGADTPALRANGVLPSPLTARQRQIIALAAQGLSNKQIADHLIMSVRSVQGHLFRACQRVGVNSRDALVALLSET